MQWDDGLTPSRGVRCQQLLATAKLRGVQQRAVQANAPQHQPQTRWQKPTTKPSTEEYKQLRLLLPQYYLPPQLLFLLLSSSSACSPPEHVPDASATRVNPHSQSCRQQLLSNTSSFRNVRSLSLFRIPSESSDASKSSKQNTFSLHLTSSKWKKELGNKQGILEDFFYKLQIVIAGYNALEAVNNYFYILSFDVKYVKCF